MKTSNRNLLMAALIGLSALTVGVSAFLADRSHAEMKHGHGPITNRLALNRLAFNRLALNGLQLNGLQLNGLHMNGLHMNGEGGESARIDAGTVAAVNGYLVIRD